MSDYSAKVIFSMRPVDKKKAFSICHGTNPLKVKELVTESEKLVIEGIVNAYIVNVHNEKAKDNKDYEEYIFETQDELYKSSSDSLWRSFQDIYETFEEEIAAGESLDIVISKVRSKNNEGCFFTCTLI